MNKNLLVRLCASICLLVGVSFFAVGCGDDGGGGSNCGPGEVLTAPPGLDQACYQECATGADCAAAGETCETYTSGTEEISLCVPEGTNNGGTNNGGTNNGGTNNGGTNNGGTGTLTCQELFQCVYSCPQQDSACQQNCISNATAEAQTQLESLNECLSANCQNSQDPNCASTNCGAELNTCAGCTGDETVVLDLGLVCAVECTEGGSECGAEQTCQTPIFSSSDAQLCARDMSGLADACTGNGDCPTPDAPQGQGFCLTEQQDPSYVNGFCLAAPCELGPNDSIGYGPQTGCGLQALCYPQQGQTGTFGLCLPLCSTIDDCRTTEDASSYTCSVFQKLQDGTVVGTCNPACSTDSDCVNGQTQGRCNAKGYCETPCNPDDANNSCETQQGGTCTSEGFCVFE